MPWQLRHVALGIAMLWAGWWVFFDVADAIQRQEFGYAVPFAMAVSAPVVIARKWPAAGGALLIVASVVSVFMYVQMWMQRFDLWQIVVLFAIMPLPPFVSGILFLLSGHAHAPHPRPAAT